jgi:hypothetical protein
MKEKYWLKGLGFGTVIGIVLYMVTIIGMFLFEGCYRIPSSQVGMCGLFTVWALALGWIWIVIGSLVGTIIGFINGKTKR